MEAQLKIAQTEGCVFIKHGVAAISQEEQSQEYCIKLTNGDKVMTRNVILATGAYLNISNHLSAFTDKLLDLSLMAQTVAFVQITQQMAEVGHGHSFIQLL